MAVDALQAYAGDTVVYVGCRPAGVCGAVAEVVADEAERLDTAGPAFERMLSERFDLVQSMSLPNWPPVRDTVSIWRRWGTLSRVGMRSCVGRLATCRLIP